MQVGHFFLRFGEVMDVTPVLAVVTQLYYKL